MYNAALTVLDKARRPAEERIDNLDFVSMRRDLNAIWLDPHKSFPQKTLRKRADFARFWVKLPIFEPNLRPPPLRPSLQHPSTGSSVLGGNESNGCDRFPARRQVMHMQRVFRAVVAKIISRTMDDSRLRFTVCHPHRETTRCPILTFSSRCPAMMGIAQAAGIRLPWSSADSDPRHALLPALDLNQRSICLGTCD